MKQNSKKESLALIISMIINIIISIIKVLGGMLGRCNSLVADGLHTFVDFITDIVAMIGSKISKKRANKTHPFGYGRSEYITGLFIGIIVFLLGIFILIKAFFEKSELIDLKLIPVIIFVNVLKMISILYLKKTGKEIDSKLLLSSANESLIDVYSSIVVIGIILLSRIEFLSKIDLIGSIGIAIFILITAFKILKENVLDLIGHTEKDKELINKLEEELAKIKDINLKDIELFEYGFYYQANVTIKVKSNVSVLRLKHLETKIIKAIKKKKYKIKYVSIEIC